MSKQVAIVFALTFVIHLISTLSYALRIAGVRTKRIALSFALFNVIVIASRTANAFQAPLLAKHVEQNILENNRTHAESDFRWLLLAAALATVVGGLLIPTFQRLFTRAIEAFNAHRSVPRLLLSGLSPSRLRQFRHVAAMPAPENLHGLSLRQAPTKILFFNVLMTALITVGVFASLYAGYLNPQLRLTANSMSPVINGFSTVLLFAFIDPYLAVLTDDVVMGKTSEAYFRKCVRLFVLSRLAGTALAQLIFVPSAKFVIFVADKL
ncbi:MAG TPA: lipid II flippase Amj family protein [Pyrinomonadaceae bacterium]|nr:lipid II flippase Amj family protein [Pyrinomonadaceae bacterium]